MPAMTTIDRPSMITWLTPAMTVGRASGSCTRKRMSRGVVPNASAASTSSLSTWRMPSSVIRTPGAIAKISVAMTPAAVPRPKKRMAGISSTIDGMVWSRSRTGRTVALTRRERAAQMPSGTAITRAITVATRTRERVDMARSHRSRESTSAKPAKASTPATRPRSHHASTARMPASSSGSGAASTASMPSYMPSTSALTASKSQERWVSSQSTPESTQSPS
ncbi:hypothetical protein SGLAM104S_00778 [Streptomyces glaucescens]